MEQPEYVASCEIEWVKIKLKGIKDLFVGSVYMPQRNMDALRELDNSLGSVSSRDDKHIVLCGDFNCPDIDWQNLTVSGNNDRAVQEELVNISVSHQLVQMQETPTRLDSVLDLVITSNSSLVKSSTTVPGISDHDIVVVDSDTKPHYNRQKPRKTYYFNRSNWQDLRSKCTDISTVVSKQLDDGHDIHTVWNYFKTSLLQVIENHVPSRYKRKNNAVPWLDRNLRRMLRRKGRLYTQARKTGKWNNYRHIQRECKRAFRKAEWTYVNEVIQEGLANNNSKPFWRYVKSRKRDNIGVSPLKSNGQLLSDGHSKAEALINQFSSVFTRDNSVLTPPLKTKPKSNK
jgi:hypothetical protein